MDDGINKKGSAFPIAALESALDQAYKTGTPSCISHDYLNVFAWTKAKGLLLDPVSCSLIGQFMIPTNEEEKEQINKASSNYIAKKHFSVDENEKDKIRKLLKVELSKNAQFVNFGFTGVIDKDIVCKLFPEIFEDCDKDNLVDYSKLKPLIPGVFEKDEFLFFSHQYFRRSYSRLNNLNEEFFTSLNEVKTEKCSIRIAIDTDMIGLKSGFLRPLEFEYWWGPKFNDSLKDIPVGVTCHIANERLKMFHRIYKTEFFWNIQDKHKTFECEEITDFDVKNPDFNFGCRYIHSMLNENNDEIIHLDGAIRGYNEEQMAKRLDIDISKQEKGLFYTKLWRIDGDIPKNKWKELICHFFRDNYLPGEYLMPEKNLDTAEYLAISNDVDKEYFEEDFFDINQNNGIYVFIDYNDKEKYAMFSDEFNLATCDYLFFIKGSYYVDFSFVELQKLLKRKGIEVKSKFPYKYIGFEDLVSNLPFIYHHGKDSVQNANITFDAIKELVSLYQKNCQEQIISFNIGVEYDDKVVTYSMLGNIVDINDLFKNKISIPEHSGEIPAFLENIKSLNKKTNNRLPLNNIKYTNGIKYRRELIFADQYCLTFDSDFINIQFHDRQVAEYMKKYHLQTAMVNIINRTECRSCGKEYTNCNCLRFETGGINIKDMIPIACVLTRHKA